MVTEGQEICNKGRREMSKPGSTGFLEEDGNRETGETKAKAEEKKPELELEQDLVKFWREYQLPRSLVQGHGPQSL